MVTHKNHGQNFDKETTDHYEVLHYFCEHDNLGGLNIFRASFAYLPSYTWNAIKLCKFSFANSIEEDWPCWYTHGMDPSL